MTLCLSMGVSLTSLRSLVGSAISPFTVALSGLTDGRAEEGTTISAVISGLEGGEIITYGWQQNDDQDDLEGFTGSSIFVDFDGGDFIDGAMVRAHVVIDGQDVYSPFVRVTAPVPVIITQASVVSGLSTGSDLLFDAGDASSGTVALTALTIDGVDQIGNVVGLSLPSEFNDTAGALVAAFTWTSTGGSTVGATITDTIVTNVITATNPPVLDPMFANDAFARSAWFDGTNETAANYPGAPANAVINVRGRKSDFSPLHGVNYRGIIGESVQFIVDVYPAGWVGGGSPLATFFSNFVTVEFERTISITSDNTFAFAINPNVPDLRVLNPININGTDYQPNATKAEFEDAASAVNIAPPIVAENASVETTIDVFKGFWSDPTGLGLTVNCTARNGVTVLNADVGTSFDAAAYAGVTLSFDFTLNGVTITQDYAVPGASYVQKTFLPGAGDKFTTTIPALTGRVLIGAWIVRPDSQERLFDAANNLTIIAYADGSVLIRLADGGNILNDVSMPAGTIPATGKHFIGLDYDISTGTGSWQINGTVTAITGGDTSEIVPAGTLHLFGRSNGTQFYEGQFSDFVMQFGGSNGLSDLYSAGPVDPADLGPCHVLLGGSMTAADFNAATQLGTATLTNVESPSNWTEVV